MTSRRRSTIAQRIVFPMPGDDETLSLYLRAGDGVLERTRTRLTLSPGAHVSLATYFGAFPAGYWTAHTAVDAVSAVGTVQGSAIVRVWAIDGTAAPRVAQTIAVEDARFRVAVPLPPECAWVWVEIDAGGAGASVSDLAWDVMEAEMATVTICITTHNRQADCLRVLERLSRDGEVAGLLERVIVVDQGDLQLRAHPDYRATAELLGDRLRLIEQPNLGGSGGFSRGMLEALDEPGAQILLLDDDVLVEPESVRRMLSFVSRSRSEMIVGAQMLSLTDRTLLYSYGERVDRNGFWWTAVNPALSSLDLATHPLETTPGLRDVLAVDFNGWWMCLVPASFVRRRGAALPMFIKWDDAEFGLRAAADGVPTVTLPGAAIWHMPWTGKDDGLDWQAYYQLRNRVVTALIHGRPRGARGVLTSSFLQDANHLVCLQYGSAAARRLALRDVLRGPEHLPATARDRLEQVRELIARSGQTVVFDDALPAPRRGDDVNPPRGPLQTVQRALAVAVHQLRPARPGPADAVQRALTRSQGKWWSLGLLDSATVESATGSGAFVARRARRVTASLFRDAVLDRIRLWRRWRALSRAYREAAPVLASRESWSQLFARDDLSSN